MATEKPINLDFTDDLKDQEFRKHFVRSLAQTEVAEQIVKMRKKRSMRQTDLADATDMKQSAISRIEQADYASWNFQTLMRIAEALRARLRILLEPIEDVMPHPVSSRKHLQMDADWTGYEEIGKAHTPSVPLDMNKPSGDYFYNAISRSVRIGGTA